MILALFGNIPAAHAGDALGELVGRDLFDRDHLTDFELDL